MENKKLKKERDNKGSKNSLMAKRTKRVLDHIFSKYKKGCEKNDISNKTITKPIYNIFDVCLLHIRQTNGKKIYRIDVYKSKYF